VSLASIMHGLASRGARIAAGNRLITVATALGSRVRRILATSALFSPPAGWCGFACSVLRPSARPKAHRAAGPIRALSCSLITPKCRLPLRVLLPHTPQGGPTNP